jgi:type VI secretion system secreted protein VgrG
MPNLDLTFAYGESSLSVRRFVVQEGISTLFTVSVWALSDDPASTSTPPPCYPRA